MKENNRGMMTVEAGILIPVILLISAGAILLFVGLGRREILRGEMVHSLYTLSLADEIDHSPREELERRAAEAVKGASTAELSSMVVGDHLQMQGSVRFGGIGDYEGVFRAAADRERDLCTGRLRRWQFYGDLTEE